MTISFLFIVCVIGVFYSPSYVSANVTYPLPVPIYAVTMDMVENLTQIVDAVSSWDRPVTLRIVFDVQTAASYYEEALTTLDSVAPIMGELVDSFYMKYMTPSWAQRRVDSYLDAFADIVDLWEVGNEINGGWLGDEDIVVENMNIMFDAVKARGLATAITFYYCYWDPVNEMFNWIANNVDDRIKYGLDYALISWYIDDCTSNPVEPDWNQVFANLSAVFPNSRVGFGELGTTQEDEKAEYLQRYYSMTEYGSDSTELVPMFIGGYFWWYGYEDFVPKTNPLWSTLNDILLDSPYPEV